MILYVNAVIQLKIDGIASSKKTLVWVLFSCLGPNATYNLQITNYNLLALEASFFLLIYCDVDDL